MITNDDLALESSSTSEPLLLNNINPPSSTIEGRSKLRVNSNTSEALQSTDDCGSCSSNQQEEQNQGGNASGEMTMMSTTIPRNVYQLTIIHKVLLLITSGIILGAILPKNTDLPSQAIQYLSSIIGYTYFLCWSISFYPQVVLNNQRKNTTGLSPDFSVLNVVGFACYSIYTAFLFWSPAVKEQYQARFHNNSDGNGSDAPAVQSNDVAFALHAFTLSFIQVGQIIYYYQQRRKNWAMTLLSMLYTTTKYFLFSCLVLCIIYAVLVAHNIHGLVFLDYLYMLSTIKLSITIIKYIPQVLMNYERKSTVGWNIWNVLLDFSGGLLSLLQLFLDAWAMDDFSAITGNWVKFALSFVSLFFDVIFLLQHYVLYPHRPQHDLDYHILPDNTEGSLPNNVV